MASYVAHEEMYALALQQCPGGLLMLVAKEKTAN